LYNFLLSLSLSRGRDGVETKHFVHHWRRRIPPPLVAQGGSEIHEYLSNGVSLYALQVYWESQLGRLDVPVLRMLKRQVRHFAAGSPTSITITLVFQAAQSVNVRWMTIDSDQQNTRTLIPVAGPCPP